MKWFDRERDPIKTLESAIRYVKSYHGGTWALYILLEALAAQRVEVVYPRTYDLRSQRFFYDLPMLSGSQSQIFDYKKI